ncbi:hypothetical protein [Saccharibacillus sp. O23]|uniref:hypothetical protein n=1 Tax=Saccharibacillus sp. O23 TaxID=2009338 RepID=UPI0015C600A9|nr:hypothetical protein [Saccharibacillus sp. O23]
MPTRPMFTRCLFLCLLFVWTAGAFPPDRAGAREADKFSTWVWNPWLLRNSSDDLLRFAASNKVATLYLQIDADMDAADYAAFIRRASAQNIRVYALDGAPRWALDRSLTDAFLNWLSDYQASADADQRFAGIHIDTEPYLLPEWNRDRDALLISWKSRIEALLAGAKRLGLPAEADIPFWFDEHAMPGQAGTLSAWLIGRFDSVTIMAYRDSADRIADVAKNELAEAAKAGKTLRIGVETNPSSETPQVTFYEEGSSYLNAQLDALRGKLGANAAFGGFAVHDYEGWKKLQEKEAASAARIAQQKKKSLKAAAGKSSEAAAPAASRKK